MTRTLTQRDAARTRKQRQRDRQRERNRLAAEALAARQERLAEDLAPHVLRTPIMSQPLREPPKRKEIIGADGKTSIVWEEGKIIQEASVLLGPRVVIVNGRPVHALPGWSANPVDELRTVLSDRHQQAARQLQMDWADVGAGCGVGAMDYLRSGGGSGDGAGGHKAMLAQIEARKRLEGAMAFLGKFQVVVCKVVLDCIPVSIWAKEIDCYPRVIVAWLVKALDQLVLFYFPEAPAPSGRLRTIGPARDAYSTEIEGVAR